MTKNKWMGAAAFLMTLALLFSAPTAPAQEKSGNGMIVAIVNGAVITADMLDREFAAMKQRMLPPGESGDGRQLAELKARVLEGLIEAELLLQEARKKGYDAGAAAVDERFKEVRDQFATEKEFQDALRKADLSADSLKAKIRRDLTVQAFIDAEFVQKASVTDAEAKAYYEAHPESFRQPAGMRASHILVKVAPGAGVEQKAEARRKIEGARERLQKGEDFAALAKELSEDPVSNSGGDLGYFTRGQMVQPFEDAAFALKPGEVSGIVETQFGYHLIKCVDTRPETTLSYSQVEPKLKEYLSQQKAREALQNYMTDLKKNAHVEKFLPGAGG